MARDNGILSRSIRLEGAQEGGVTERLRAGGELSIELENGRKVHLDPSDRRTPTYAQVLEGLAALRRPVYVEVDPESDRISLLLVPHVARVVDLRESEVGFEVMLDVSHARHRLRREEPGAADIAARLREAERTNTPVILVEDDQHDIIDVRRFEPGPDDGPSPPLPDRDPSLRRGWFGRLWYWIWWWPIWPWQWFGCISQVRAQQAFTAMSGTTCAPLTVPAPCIPFLYPDDGCWARAHEMCRLMIATGLSPRKVWISGSLHTLTRNNPNCFVNWGWHVAPTLCVRRRWWWWSRLTLVIDPSLFTGPVNVPTWKSVQGDPSATLTYTAASDYLWGATDPTYSHTNYYLNFYRLQLQTRSVNVGPPPYANCP